MNKGLIPLVAWSLSGTASALVMYESISLDQIPYDRPDPPGLRDLSNFKTRVYATHMIAPSFGDGYQSYDVYFGGDAFVFNRFMKQYARLKKGEFYRDEPLSVILHDANSVPRFPGESIPPFNWSLRITQGSATRALPPLLPDSETIHVYVDVYISSRLLLSELKIPPEVRVQSQTAFDRFVLEHEDRRLGGRLASLKQQAEELQREIQRLSQANPAVGSRPASRPADEQ